MDDDPTLLIGGIDFAEGPRWHEGRLWYSDFYQRTISSVSADGERRVEHEGFDDRPSGLGWMPDGRLVVVSMTKRRVLIEDGDGFAVHADLSDVAAWHCNDMVMDARGNAYVGNFGFDLDSADTPAGADLALVRPDGSVEVAASGLLFPNGAVITEDGHTLIVGETFGGGYEAFTINDDATLTDRRRWADVPNTAPDGCTLDAEGGIWFADAIGSQVVRITEGGEITDQVALPMQTFACTLGGDDGRTLFVLCAPGSQQDVVQGKGAGAIYTITVTHPHAGRP